MVANKSIERLERSAVKLTITVAKDEIAKEYASMMADYSRSVHIDGFRKGKVPIAVLERKFGDGLRLDAMGRIMEKSVEEAIKEIDEKPLAYSTPALEGQPEFKLDADFSFTVTYDVFPKIEAPDWKGLEIELPQVGVSAEDEEHELAQVRERNAIVIEKEAGAPAAKGDVATVDYTELGADGAVISGSERKDFTFEIGTGYNLYKFDDDFIGMKKSESKKIAKSFPGDYEYKELAGRTVDLSVTLTNLKAKKLPELDDDLAQDVSEKYKTLADLKADLKKQLEKRLSDKLKQIQEKTIIEGLLSRVKVELPASMVDAELGMRLENLMRQMGFDSIEKLDRTLSFSGKTRADLAADWRPNAEKAIATRIVIEKLVEDGKYECSEEDLAAEFQRMSEESGLSVDEVKAEYDKRGSMEYLRDRIREDKLIAAVLSESKVKKGKKISFVDLFADNE